jgi:hypothetical protein
MWENPYNSSPPSMYVTICELIGQIFAYWVIVNLSSMSFVCKLQKYCTLWGYFFTNYVLILTKYDMDDFLKNLSCNYRPSTIQSSIFIQKSAFQND